MIVMRKVTLLSAGFMLVLLMKVARYMDTSIDLIFLMWYYAVRKTYHIGKQECQGYERSEVSHGSQK